jgi:hypothetical protein
LPRTPGTRGSESRGGRGSSAGTEIVPSPVKNQSSTKQEEEPKLFFRAVSSESRCAKDVNIVAVIADIVESRKASKSPDVR